MPATKQRKPRKPRATANTAVRTGRLRAADPFELIRWLARSQPDPRKALAELVQNSLDAGARTIKITRRRHNGRTELRIFDDGGGVIPVLDREEALAYLATHIGHSRKRELTPEQRRELMLQGKYGIGLLGFWSIGGELEIRSQMPGQSPMLLHAQRHPRARLHRRPRRHMALALRGQAVGSEQRPFRLPRSGRDTSPQAALSCGAPGKRGRAALVPRAEPGAGARKHGRGIDDHRAAAGTRVGQRSGP